MKVTCLTGDSGLKPGSSAGKLSALKGGVWAWHNPTPQSALKGGVSAFRYADFRFDLNSRDNTSSHPELCSCLKGTAGVYLHPGRESAFTDSENNDIRTLLYVSSRYHGLTPPYSLTNCHVLSPAYTCTGSHALSPPYGTMYRSALTPRYGATYYHALTPPFKAYPLYTSF